MTFHIRQLISAAFIFIFLVLGQSVLHAEKITDISIQYAGAPTVDEAALSSQISSKVGSELDAMEVEKDIQEEAAEEKEERPPGKGSGLRGRSTDQ